MQIVSFKQVDVSPARALGGNPVAWCSMPRGSTATRCSASRAGPSVRNRLRAADDDAGGELSVRISHPCRSCRSPAIQRRPPHTPCSGAAGFGEGRALIQMRGPDCCRCGVDHVDDFVACRSVPAAKALPAPAGSLALLDAALAVLRAVRSPPRLYDNGPLWWLFELPRCRCARGIVPISPRSPRSRATHGVGLGCSPPRGPTPARGSPTAPRDGIPLRPSPAAPCRHRRTASCGRTLPCRRSLRRHPGPRDRSLRPRGVALRERRRLDRWPLHHGDRRHVPLRPVAARSCKSQDRARIALRLLMLSPSDRPSRAARRR